MSLSKTDVQRIRENCEYEGEETVRERLQLQPQMGGYESLTRPVAKQWLADKERERADQDRSEELRIAADANRIALEANQIARQARIWAAAAALIATIALIA